MVHQSFLSLLGGLSDALRLDLTLHDDETLVAELENDIVAEMSFEEKTLHVTMSVSAPIPRGLDPSTDEFAGKLLHANYEIWRTNGVSLGFIQDDRRVKLTAVRPINSLSSAAALTQFELLLETCSNLPELIANSSGTES